MSSLWNKLLENVDGKKLCLGIDPHLALLEVWDHPELNEFALAVLEAADSSAVAAVKPQSAFFEQFGASGVKVLQETLESARLRGIPTILDVKRGDIGSTNLGYAVAYLGKNSPLRADAVTISPYLGVESVRNICQAAHDNDRGVFLLCLTSNPEAKSVQLAQFEGRTVAKQVFDFAQEFNAKHGVTVGLVVGATIDNLAVEAGVDLSKFNGPILAPGVGAQGAGGAELDAVFGSARGKVLPSVSRGVLAVGPNVQKMKQKISQFVDELGGVND
jgi:orotidine-5'-phosphate decarboxylase